MKTGLLLKLTGPCILAFFLATTQPYLVAQGSQRVVDVKGFASVDGIRLGDSFKVAIVLTIEQGYHINAHTPTLQYLIPTQVNFQKSKELAMGPPLFPVPVNRSFEFSPSTPLAVHEGEVIVIAEGHSTKTGSSSSVTVLGQATVQACSHNQCLAPVKISFKIPIKILKAGEKSNPINQELFDQGKKRPLLKSSAPGALSDRTLKEFGTSRRKGTLSETIANQGLLLTLGLVFLAGLALNTTPCVYPIIPITIGFFVNQAEGRLTRTFLTASSYVFGMAITYSTLGVVASMTQGIFGAALQHPLVLVGLACLMVAMALSMFGLYEFRLPVTLNRLAAHSSQSTSGILGALLMGLTMGIVAAPCIGPFVIGLLVHVGGKGDPVYGFLMFFVLALGLGLPYLFLGIFSGRLKNLPHSGQWLVTVRQIFGMILLGMALYFLNPLLGSYTSWGLAVLSSISAGYLILVQARRAKPLAFAWTLRSLGAGLALATVLLVITSGSKLGISWEIYSEAALVQAQQDGKIVMIDVYADWCLPCKELDEFTFTDSEVRSAAQRLVSLKLDLTTTDPDSAEERARERLGILGVPTILFLDSTGREHKELRLEGFEAANLFLARIRRMEASSYPVEQRNPSAPKIKAIGRPTMEDL